MIKYNIKKYNSASGHKDICYYSKDFFITKYEFLYSYVEYYMIKRKQYKDYNTVGISLLLKYK